MEIVDQPNFKVFNICRYACQSVPQGISEGLPFYKTLWKNGERKRRKTSTSQAKRAPQKLSQIDLPEDCRKLKNGEDFLQYESGSSDKERYYVFATKTNIYITCNWWRVEFLKM